MGRLDKGASTSGTSDAGLGQRLEAALGAACAVERELAGGGMARVFVANDRRLGRRVVVKVLHPDLAAGLSARRFEREVKLVARLQHPHVVPLLTAGDVDGLPYYTMPYVDGQSLRARLACDGALPIADALRLLRELADALSYAHGQGVVHRDLKPENVLLSAGHAVVADFGVAKALVSATRDSVSTESAAPTSTALGAVVGTPAYMAPEQVAADPATDHRADLYAFGLVAYEVLTGRHAFAGRGPQQLLAAQIAEAPPPLTQLRPDAPPALTELVMRCLAKPPDERPQSADEVLALLESAATPAGSTSPRPGGRARPTRKYALFGAAATLVVIAGGVASWRAARVPALDPKRVLVAAFENETGDRGLGPLGQMTADWLAQGLARTGRVEVLDLRSVTMERGAEPRAVARRNGAGTLVTGSYYRQGDSLRFQPRVVDVVTGRTLQAIDPVSGPAADVGKGVEAVRQRVMGALASRFDPIMKTWVETTSQPPSYAAYREWAQGVDLFLAVDHRRAIPHLLRAAALDSTFTSPLLWASSSYMVLGDYAKAESLAAIVNRLRERLPPADLYLLDTFLARFHGDRAGQLEASRRALSAAPRSTLALYMAGLNAVRMNRPREALDALTRMDTTRFAAAGFLTYWYTIADAAHILTDYRRELSVAGGARAQFPDRVGPLASEARALAALGSPGEVRRRVDAIIAAARLSEPAVPALLAVALELRAHGHKRDATETLARALAVHQAQPARARTTLTARASRAELLYAAERWAEARVAYDSLARERPDSVAYLGRVGTLAARMGDRDAAARIADRLAALRRPYLFGEHTVWRARIAALSGDSAHATALVRQSFDEGFPQATLESSGEEAPLGIWAHRDTDLEPLRGYAPFREWLRPRG